MALKTREALGALTEKWRQLGHEIGFGIGIAHGYATLGTIGFEGRFDYAAIGTVSNVASRLCDEAKPGQILISTRVLIAVKDAAARSSVISGLSRLVGPDEQVSERRPGRTRYRVLYSSGRCNRRATRRTHHNTDYYDRFFGPGAYGPAHAAHMATWHQ
jgi:class 3 adenylate cyclase